MPEIIKLALEKKVSIKSKHRLGGSALDWSLVVLFTLSIALVVLAHEDPVVRDAVCRSVSLCFQTELSAFWNKLIYDISMGSVLSLIFYGLIVRLPEAHRKARLKRSFQAQYKAFKLGCIETFLVISRSDTSTDNQHRLLKLEEFRSYFKQPVGDGQNRWDAVANGINDYYLVDIVTRLDTLRDEAQFFLNNVDVDDHEAMGFFKNMAVVIQMSTRQSVNVDYDVVKSLMGFLWPMFTGWSFIDGYRDYDAIEQMIDKA